METAPVENPIPLQTDFADWLSPMLVKELRQGVRTRVFVGTFILLQVVMLMDLCLTLLVARAGQDSTTGTVFFWLIVGLPVLAILPFGGLNAIAGEIKANTLELIFLTRLTARRIVVGKWLAIFAQALLLVCAVLPYLVLRYFIGGVNVTSELETLAWMLAGSALLAAFATGLSAYPMRIVRPLSALFGVFLLIFGTSVLGPLLTFGGVTGPAPGFLDIAALDLCGAILLILGLEIGAARIAPPAENHSAVMRLLALGGFAVALAANFVVHWRVPVTITTFVIAAGICAVALCETPRWIPSLYRPFAGRGWPGRMAGRLLYPGWHTGILFTLVVFAAFGSLLAHQKVFDKAGSIVGFVAVAGTLLLPVALIRVCLPRTTKAVPLFFAVQAVSLIALICASVCDGALRTNEFKELVSFLPLCTLISLASDNDLDAAGHMTAVGITTLVSAIALFAAAIWPLRQATAMEKDCLQPSAPPPDAPVA